MSYQREYERRLRVGMLGIGGHTYRNLLPTMTYLPVELCALCVRSDLERAARTAAQYGDCTVYDDPARMYAEVRLDAVFICVSEREHPRLVMQALDAGLHVWLEKPPAERAAEVTAMIAHRGDRVVVVGFKKAFMPAAFKAREVAASEEFGDLQSCLGVYPVAIPPHGEAVLEQRTFSEWLGNGVHPLSFLVSVGGPVSAVTAHLNGNGHGACVLQFANGTVGNLHLASGPHPNERYTLFGQHWHLAVENASRVVLQRGAPFEYGRSTTFAPPGFDHGTLVWEAQNALATLEGRGEFVQGIYNQMRHFCDCALAGEPAEHGTLEFAFEVMRAYEAALLSNGRTVAVSEIG